MTLNASSQQDSLKNLSIVRSSGRKKKREEETHDDPFQTGRGSGEIEFR